MQHVFIAKNLVGKKDNSFVSILRYTQGKKPKTNLYHMKGLL